MSGESGHQEPPTYYANIVTSLLTEDVMRREPIARVVVTFSAARDLKEYLELALPRIEESRRAGRLT